MDAKERRISILKAKLASCGNFKEYALRKAEIQAELDRLQS